MGEQERAIEVYHLSVMRKVFQLLLDPCAAEPFHPLEWSTVVAALDPLDHSLDAEGGGDVEISPGGSAGGSVRIGVGHGRGLKAVGRRAARRIIAGTFSAIASAAAHGS